MCDPHPSPVAVPHPVALACPLPGDALRERMAEVRALLSRAAERRALDDGAPPRFSADDEGARRLPDFVLFERRCCSSPAFELLFEPPRDAVAPRVRGRGEGIALARALAGIV